jgi:hypothetical protein
LSVPSHLKVSSSFFFLAFASVGCLATTVIPSLLG